ncbi:type ISP restriction/modification enzyme [Streptomyces sp. NPDC004610]|uniref:type ISP restriction/modification enzyme n=1 Tax=unclassified Streptomyces TaxID=2593676 RepID=UPI00339E1CAA
MRSVPHDAADDAPPLADLMPWSVAPPRLGRGWPAAPDPASLKARWDALLKARGPDREALFEPTRARTPHSAVGQLPGHPGGATGTEPLARAEGPCPEPVRALAAPFDEQWLIPDQRLLDAARPELWRVADDRQVFVTETPGGPGPRLLATTLFPLLRPGRVRPLFRRPGGREPNLAPGLTEYLGARLGGAAQAPEPLDVLAWILSAVRADLTVPLTADPARWALGVASGRRALWLMRRDGERPKLPGGRRPYVRAPLPDRPGELRYDREEEALYLGEGRISPVPVDAWDFEAGGVRVLEEWFLARTGEPEPGTLAAIRPATWPQTWTSELLELITVLALLAELPPLPDAPASSPVTAAELRAAGVLPVPASARRPATVLDTPEEGPQGQLALI